MAVLSNYNSWLTCLNRNPQAKLRLFCFNYAGGGPLSFRGWSDYLPTFVEVCPIQIPGRGSRFKEPPFTQLRPLVQELTTALLPYFDKPFVFFGHSMGALVSFEMAQLLRKEHSLNPEYLFVSGRRAPQLPNPNPPIHALPEAKFWEEIRRFNGTPEEVLNNTELREMLLPTLRADFAVFETYVYTPKPPLDCPITALGGLEDSEATYDELEAWKEHTNQGFLLQTFPGGHFFIHSSHSFVLGYLSQKLHQIANNFGTQYSSIYR